MKAQVGAFNQEKALVGAFSVIVQPVVEPMEHCTALVPIIHHTTCRESLLRARQALVVPKKRTLEELVNSKNVKSLVPPLPREVAVSFYLQSWKLIFAVYHMVTDKGVSR